jgi:hypothetical protein
MDKKNAKCELGKISASEAKYSATETGENFELAFVNREQVAMNVAEVLILSTQFDHRLLTHCGQHNGSGKTSFVRHFHSIMQSNWEKMKSIVYRLTYYRQWQDVDAHFQRERCIR